jgi:hypothetical protein
MLQLSGIKPHNINIPNKPFKRKIVKIVTAPKTRGGCGCGGSK